VIKFPHELEDHREFSDFKLANDRGKTEENEMLKTVLSP